MQPDLTDSKPVSFALYHQFIHWEHIFKLPGNSLIQNLNLGFMHAQSLQSCPTVCDPVDSSLPGSSLWDSPDKNAEVSCRFFCQGIFSPLGSNPCLLHLLHWQAEFFTTGATWEALSFGKRVKCHISLILSVPLIIRLHTHTNLMTIQGVGWVIEWKWNFANEHKYFYLPPSSRNINMGLFYCLRKVETHHQGNIII